MKRQRNKRFYRLKPLAEAGPSRQHAPCRGWTRVRPLARCHQAGGTCPCEDCAAAQGLWYRVLHKLKLDLRASTCRAGPKPIKGIYTAQLMLALLLSSLGPAGPRQSRAGVAGGGKADMTVKQTPTSTGSSPS